MSAKRFSSLGVMIVLLAIAIVGGGCASLRPPTLETGQAVETDVRDALRKSELEGNVPPESVQTGMSFLGELIAVLGQGLAPLCGIH